MRRPTSKLRSGYLSGPMSGIPEANHPAFHRLEKKWRRWGWEVINPALINPDQVPNEHLTADEARAASIWSDLEGVRDTDVLILMKGWEASIGGRAEVYTARSLNHPVFDADTGELLTID